MVGEQKMGWVHWAKAKTIRHMKRVMAIIFMLVIYNLLMGIIMDQTYSSFSSGWSKTRPSIIWSTSDLNCCSWSFSSFDS
jgi:hypothetical protein